MTEQEFIKIIVLLHAKTYYKVNNKRYDCYDANGGYKVRSGKLLKDINLDDCLMIYWCSGGVGGGNCWSDGGNYSIEGEQEPPFDNLDIILEHVCPKITYLEYKKLLYGVTPKLVEFGSWEVNEYYGNSTRYSYKRVVLRSLWERLQVLGVISDES